MSLNTKKRKLLKVLFFPTNERSINKQITDAKTTFLLFRFFLKFENFGWWLVEDFGNGCIVSQEYGRAAIKSENQILQFDAYRRL